MRRVSILGVGFCMAVACGGKGGTKAVPTGESTSVPGALRSVTDFESIADPIQRSHALFREMGKVLNHPRCSNCHPNGDRPMQREALAHHPLVVRGTDGMGAPGMNCGTCHGDRNFENVPGAVGWHLAPIEMAWVGKSLGEICTQIKDPSRNGGKTLVQLVEHVANDALVSYGWSPPPQLEPAPGTQVQFAQLVEGWVEAGAHCP